MVYLPTFESFMGQMLVNIPAPWILWDGFGSYEPFPTWRFMWDGT